MQEESDAVAVTTLAQHFCKRDEMIIVHPDDVIGPQKFVQLIAK